VAGLVPAISIVWSAALFIIGITGTRPVMTGREAPGFAPDRRIAALFPRVPKIFSHPS
jgi:hypothetical protein